MENYYIRYTNKDRKRRSFYTNDDQKAEEFTELAESGEPWAIYELTAPLEDKLPEPSEDYKEPHIERVASYIPSRGCGECGACACEV